MSDLETAYLPKVKMLITRLKNRVTAQQVEQWRATLEQALTLLPPNQSFKLLVDLAGYDPVDLAAHKAMRNIIPLLLARYAFRTALLDLFENIDLPLTSTDSIICQAVAHVHHDRAKMEEYQRRLNRPNEQFFTDSKLAFAWLKNQNQLI